MKLATVIEAYIVFATVTRLALKDSLAVTASIRTSDG
jgi:hypothetical protein